MTKLRSKIWKWIKPRIVPATICLIALAVVIVMSQKIKAPEPIIESAPEKIINVTVEKIVPVESISDTYLTNGNIEENFKTDVSAELAGRVLAYAAPGDEITTPYKLPKHKPGAKVLTEGSFVKKGQPLMYLDTSQIKPKRDIAYAKFKNAEIQLKKNAKAILQGVITSTDMEEAQLNYDTAKSNYIEMQRQLDNWIIRAPISGELNKLPIKVGEYVTPGKEVAEIVDLEKVKLVVRVSSADVRFMTKGRMQKLQRQGEKPLKGPISYIGKIADKETRTTRVEILLDNPKDKNGKRKFLSGDQFNVLMHRREIKNAIMIPQKAVIPISVKGQTKHVVYIAERIPGEPADSKFRIAKRVFIKTALFKGNDIQIVDGLKADDELIVLGAKSGVGPGQKVIIRPFENPFENAKKNSSASKDSNKDNSVTPE